MTLFMRQLNYKQDIVGHEGEYIDIYLFTILLQKHSRIIYYGEND